jgi:hypothetical protein
MVGIRNIGIGRALLTTTYKVLEASHREDSCQRSSRSNPCGALDRGPLELGIALFSDTSNVHPAFFCHQHVGVTLNFLAWLINFFSYAG